LSLVSFSEGVMLSVAALLDEEEDDMASTVLRR
jgi:hypothetical protein